MRGGETLSSIAANLWGDSALWYKLAEANGMSSATALAEGQTLIVPAGVNTNRYNASTFRPYDASDAVGDASPTTPKLPKHNKCGMMGQVMMVAVGLAVTAILPHVSAFLSTLGGRILGGLLSSAASQVFGVASEIQDKFDWKAVAMAGVTAGVAGGLDKVGAFARVGIKGSSFGIQAAQGSITNALTQGIGVATHLQSKFDFAGVAAAALGQGATSQIGGKGAGARLFRIGADELVSAASRSVITGTSFGDNLVAVLPSVIGRTIGGVFERALDDRQDFHFKAKAEVEAVIQCGSEGHRIQFAELQSNVASDTPMTGVGRSSDTQVPMPTSAYPIGGGIAGKTYPTPREFVKWLLRDTDGLTPDQALPIFRRHIAEWIEGGANQARVLYGSDTPVDASHSDGDLPNLDLQIANARNTSILAVYSALAIELPDFQWLAVGTPTAIEVRAQLPLVDMAREVPFAGMGGYTELLSQTQVQIAVDVGSYVLAYAQYGARALATSNVPEAVKSAFTNQARSDDARARGDREEASRSGMVAAQELVSYEQRSVQGMWDIFRGPLQILTGMGRFNPHPTVHTAAGPIESPNIPGGYIWDVDYRVEAARHAFAEMNRLAFAPSADPGNRALVGLYFHDLYGRVHPNW